MTQWKEKIISSPKSNVALYGDGCLFVIIRIFFFVFNRAQRKQMHHMLYLSLTVVEILNFQFYKNKQ
jgi:hypothetical protein